MIPLRFEFECISFGSLGQNSLVVPLPNVIQTTLHCIYIYLPTSQCQSKYIDTTFTFSLTYFYQTRVRSLAMLVSDSLTHSLTDSCLVSLIDIILACEEANPKLVDVVTVALEHRGSHNLLQIWKLRFGQKAILLFRL